MGSDGCGCHSELCHPHPEPWREGRAGQLEANRKATRIPQQILWSETLTYQGGTMPKQRKRDGVYWRKDRRKYYFSHVDENRLPRFSVSHLLGQPFVIVSPFVERQLEPLIVVPAMGVRPLIQPVITAPEREELSECEKENRGT